MTKRNRFASIWAGIVGGLLLWTAAPASASAQESGVEMWGRVCGRCHRIQPPNKYDSDAWRAIMVHMALTARLTPQEEAAITEFLMGAARPIAAAPAPRPGGEVGGVVSAAPDTPSHVSGDSSMAARGAAVYRAQCTACHGNEGKGDGPAAAALTPRPPDLTRSELVRTMSDEDLFEFLSAGKGTMPGFGKILTERELRDLVAWLRSKNNP